MTLPALLTVIGYLAARDLAKALLAINGNFTQQLRRKPQPAKPKGDPK